MDKAQHSRMMKACRGDHLKPEVALREALLRAGAHFWSNVKSLPGTPDVLLGNLAVFVHGCYWHCCPVHWKEPADAGWRAKFEANRRRDRRVRAKLRARGLRTMVVWEHDLRTTEKADAAARRVLARKDRD